MTTYIPCTIDDIAAGVRWHTPAQNQGQIIEVSYAAAPGAAHEANHGDEYQRVTDRSDQSVAYARRDDVAPVRWAALAPLHDSLQEFDQRSHAEHWSMRAHGHDHLVQLDGDTIRDATGRTLLYYEAVRALRAASSEVARTTEGP